MADKIEVKEKQEVTLAEIMGLVEPDGTRAAFDRQRLHLMTELADLKAAYVIESDNDAPSAEAKAFQLNDLEKRARIIFNAIQKLDQRLAKSEDALWLTAADVLADAAVVATIDPATEIKAVPDVGA